MHYQPKINTIIRLHQQNTKHSPAAVQVSAVPAAAGKYGVPAGTAQLFQNAANEAGRCLVDP